MRVEGADLVLDTHRGEWVTLPASTEYWKELARMDDDGRTAAAFCSKYGLLTATLPAAFDPTSPLATNDAPPRELREPLSRVLSLRKELQLLVSIDVGLTQWVLLPRERQRIRRRLATVGPVGRTSTGRKVPLLSRRKGSDEMLLGKAAAWFAVRARELGKDLRIVYSVEAGSLSIEAPTLRSLVVLGLLRAASRPHGMRDCRNPHCGEPFMPTRSTQEYCSPACGNRARVARSTEKSRAAARRTT